ncbi:hypothetical protein ABE042_20240 [Viridibacillus arvi]|uniref:hypothetical protein n=1 Tax=Viridibacillus arvi TaxID=263475 RepID=UPI003D2725BC
MEIGDYIKVFLTWKNSWSSAFTLEEKGYTEYPVTGLPPGTSGFFYAIKIAKGLIVADRVIIHTYN